MTYPHLNSLKQLLPQTSRRHSLRRLLMSYLGAVWLVILLFTSASVVSFVHRTEVAAWRGRQGEAARNATQTVAAFIQRADDSLTLVALLGRDELGAEPDVMDQVLHQNPALLEIVYLDVNGAVIANAAADQPLLANLFTIPQSQWFLRAKADQHYYSSIQISSNDKPYLIVALPAPDGKVVAARLRMNLLWEVVADIRFGATGRAYVVADTGQIIAHTNPEVVLANTNIGELANLPALSELRGGEWYGEYLDLRGEAVVGVAAAVPGTDWVVITELPQREAFASSRSAVLLLGGGIALLMAVMMWVSARYLGRAIFQPMEALRDGSERIGGGDLGHRIELRGQDEVGQVALAFNIMALRLQERDAQLATRTAALANEVVERKQAQEALHQLNQELEMRVQERTAQLARTNQELQKEIAGHRAAEEKLLRIAERQALLYQVLRAVSGQLELDAVARLAVDAIVRFTGWPHVRFAVPNEAGTHWVIRAAGGELAAEVGMTCPISRGVIGRAFRTAQTQLVPDVRTDPDYTGEHPVLLSELTLPIKQSERVLAVLNLESDRPAAFGAEELQLGESLAEAIALSLENARLFQTAQAELAERQRAEAALRESEERYRLHFENVSDVVFSIDREFRLLSISPSVARHLGYLPEELVGRPIQELGLVAPDCLEAAFRDTLRVLEGEPVESAVYTFVARDGTRLIGEVSGAPLLRDGQVVASVSVARDITERVRAEEQIKASLHEKEVLLKEIHHRVKNNLQVISSLLNLQSKGIQDPSTMEMFRESQNRVRSMALIHEKLYRSDDLARIDFGEYVRNLAAFLVRSYRANTGPIALTVNAHDTYLGIDNAVPCGLIINELVSNALKHAFSSSEDRSPDDVPACPGGQAREDKENEIHIALRCDQDDCLTLVVADNGVGFPTDLDFRNTQSLGMQLVNTLVNQLRGTVELVSHGGAQFKITFPRS